jgi:hypothetical protein
VIVPRLRRLAALLGAVALAGVAAPGALACDQGQQARAAYAGGGRPRPPLVVGDSTMYFSVPLLARLGLDADAKGCRTFFTGVELLGARWKAGTLPRLSILALGANGDIPEDHLQSALDTVGPDRVLGLVTARNTEATSGAAMRKAAAAHPDRVLLIDWASYSAGHPSWFAGDGLHVDSEGAQAYAEFIRRRADPLMPPSAARLGLPRSAATAKRCGELGAARDAARVYIVRGRERVSCARARSLARLSPLRPIPSWRPYAWHVARGGPWSAVYRRDDGKVLVATRGPAT